MCACDIKVSRVLQHALQWNSHAITGPWQTLYLVKEMHSSKCADGWRQGDDLTLRRQMCQAQQPVPANAFHPWPWGLPHFPSPHFAVMERSLSWSESDQYWQKLNPEKLFRSFASLFYANVIFFFISTRATVSDSRDVYSQLLKGQRNSSLIRSISVTPEQDSEALNMPCLTFAWTQPAITATDKERKREPERD